MDYLNIDTFRIGFPSNPSRIIERQYDVDLYGRHENPSTIGRVSQPSSDVIGPFQIIFGTSANTIQVAPGTINGFLPSNILTDLSVEITGVSYIYAQVTASAGKISSVLMKSNTSVPSGWGFALGSPPVSFDILVGYVEDSTTFYQAIDRSISVYVKEQVTTTDGTWYIWTME